MKSLEITTSRQSSPARNPVDKGLTPEIPSRSHLCRSAETSEGFLMSGSPWGAGGTKGRVLRARQREASPVWCKVV